MTMTRGIGSGILAALGSLGTYLGGFSSISPIKLDPNWVDAIHQKLGELPSIGPILKALPLPFWVCLFSFLIFWALAFLFWSIVAALVVPILFIVLGMALLLAILWMAGWLSLPPVPKAGAG
ncbi:MAG: hypothetical protein QXN33_00245 [Candidatus Bathyarchaeia archaeon]